MSTDNQKLISFIEGRLRNDAMFLPVGEYNKYQRMAQEVALAALKAADGGLTAADYEEALADKRRLVRELDVLINGENAAQQASLCDIVSQVRSEGLKPTLKPGQYQFDAPALDIAQKIMECRATAAEDGWPDVRLKAAIQCLVIEAMKWAAPAVPDSFVMAPRALTAENGAKAALMGEFKEEYSISCPECFGDDDCETCDRSGRIHIVVPVSWTTIKEIWKKGVEHFQAAAPAPGGEHG